MPFAPHQRRPAFGVDLVRAVERNEAATDPHPCEIAVEFPRRLTRGGGQRVAGRVQRRRCSEATAQTIGSRRLTMYQPAGTIGACPTVG